MSGFKWMHRVGRLVPVMIVLGTLASCSEDDYGTEPLTGIAAQVDAIRLSVGTTQTITIFKDGKITLAPVSFVRPSVVITATLLDDAGNALQNANPAEIQVNMGVETGTGLGGVTYTRTNAFSGTLAGTNAGILNLGVSLFDVVKRRTVFGPYNIPVVIR